MNLRTTQINKTVRRKSPAAPRRRKRNSGGFSFSAFVKIAGPIMILFMLASVWNVFNSETEQLNRKSVKIKEEMKRLERDIANYKIKTERLKGRFIYKQVAYFNLNLHSPVPGQVRKLRLRRYPSNSAVSEPETMLISQR